MHKRSELLLSQKKGYCIPCMQKLQINTLMMINDQHYLMQRTWMQTSGALFGCWR